MNKAFALHDTTQDNGSPGPRAANHPHSGRAGPHLEGPQPRFGAPSGSRPVQLKAASIAPETTTGTTAPASSGTSLPDDVRTVMERRFRVSFADVRIHAGSQAAAHAATLGADAFTQGSNIHFAANRFNPHSSRGLGLLAHELTHVVQQRNGRFGLGTAEGQAARTRAALEQEAEHNERQALLSVGALAVRGDAPDQGIQRSPSLLEQLRARAFGNIEAIAEYVAANTTDPLIRRLHALGGQLRGTRELALRAELAARFEAIYNDLRARAPGWLPVPAISFAGPPVQYAATVAIPAGMILLLVLFLLVMLWLLSNLDPATRRARERAAEEVIDNIREALRPRPRPAPPEAEPQPAPETLPTPKTRPDARPRDRVGPDVVPDAPTRPRRDPGAYPLLWPTVFGPPMLFDVPIVSFVKTPQQERDETYSWEVRRELWARHRRGDPGLMPSDYHAHHIVPLFLGGLEGARGNITFLPGGVHLRGHGQLASQPQMRTPPPPLRPLPASILRHPTGTRYYLAGFK